MNGIFEGLRLRRTEKENQGMERENESKTGEIESTVVLVSAINNLADAIREHTRAINGEDNEVDDGQFDLSGNRI